MTLGHIIACFLGQSGLEGVSSRQGRGRHYLLLTELELFFIGYLLSHHCEGSDENSDLKIK